MEVGPFEIRTRISDVAYKLYLPPELSGVHNVFHVSILKKYVEDPTHVLHHQQLVIQPDASYIAKPIAIIDTKEQVLRTRTIHWVKVQWELHEQELKKYPHLLPQVCSYFVFSFGDQMSQKRE